MYATRSCSFLRLFLKMWNSALPAAAEEPTTLRTNSTGGLGLGGSRRAGNGAGFS